MKRMLLIEDRSISNNHSRKCKIPTVVSDVNAGNLALKGDFFSQLGINVEHFQGVIAIWVKMI